jgi:peptidoglycan/LPS O-acetylase OafA/YrhL
VKINNSLTASESIVLDFVRGTSAQLVLVGHLLSIYGLQSKYRLPLLQNFGVCVFFVLSGFLICHSVLSKNNQYNYKTFMIDRFSRIYYSYLPALLLVVIADYVFLDIGSSNYKTNFNYTIKNFITNLLMLQAYPFHHKFGWEAFGTGRVFWTVCVEWWIYIIFGYIYYSLNGKQIFKYGKVLFLIAIPFSLYYIGFRGDGLAIAWFLGLLIRVTYYKKLNIKKYSGSIIIIAIIGIGIRMLKHRDMYDVGIILLFCIILATIFNTNYFKVEENKLFVNISRYLAKYSYSLYLTHYSVIIIFKKYLNNGYYDILNLVLISNLIAFLFYLIFEKNYFKLKNTLRKRFD